MNALKMAACLVMALLVTACMGSGHLIGPDGKPKTVASPIASGMGRIVVIRDTDAGMGPRMAVLEVGIDGQPGQAISNNAVFVYDLPAGKGYRISLTQPWWDKGPYNSVTGDFTPTLDENMTLYFTVGYAKAETISGGVKALSILLSGDSGVRHSFYIHKISEEQAKEYLTKLARS